MLAQQGTLEVCTLYSKTPIYRGFWEKGNIRGKSGFAVNRGFVCLHMVSPIWGKGDGRGISGFVVNRGAVNGVILYRSTSLFLIKLCPCYR